MTIQAQDSTKDQLERLFRHRDAQGLDGWRLYGLANTLGLYDAADALRSDRQGGPVTRESFEGRR